MRVFVAVEMPSSVVETIGSLQDELRGSGAKVRWVRPDTAHFTVKFLGEVDADEVLTIDGAVRPVAAGFAPLELRLRGLGVFPNRRRPRVAWAGMHGDTERLGELKAAVDAALADAGFDPDRRKFHPHVTLGRVKGRRRVARLMDEIERRQDVEIGDVRVDELVLLQSHLSPQGARYERLSSYPLRASGG